MNNSYLFNSVNTNIAWMYHVSFNCYLPTCKAVVLTCQLCHEVGKKIALSLLTPLCRWLYSSKLCLKKAIWMALTITVSLTQDTHQWIQSYAVMRGKSP